MVEVTVVTVAMVAMEDINQNGDQKFDRRFCQFPACWIETTVLLS